MARILRYPARTLVSACLLTAALVLAAATATPEPPSGGVGAPAPERGPRAARAQEILSEAATARESWQNEYRTLLTQYAEARDRAAQAQLDWRIQRKRQRLRGDHKAEARDEIEASHEALADAMSRIREFRDRARREGAEPGWLYSVEDEFPDIASAIAAR